MPSALSSRCSNVHSMVRPLRARFHSLGGSPFPEGWRPFARIEDLRAPLLLHGDADELVPISQGKKLYNAARRPKKMHVFVDCDHNDVMDRAGEELAEVIVAWHKGLPAPKRGPT